MSDPVREIPENPARGGEDEGRRSGSTIVGDLFHLLQSRVSQIVLGFLVGLATARIWGAEAVGIIGLALVIPNLVVDGVDLGTGKSLPFLIGRSGRTLREVTGAMMTMWVLVTALSVAIVAGVVFSPMMETVPALWGVLGILTIPFSLLTTYSLGFAIGVQRLAFFKHMIWARDPLVLVVVLIGGLGLGYGGSEYGWIRILAAVLGWALAALAGIRLISGFTSLRPRWDFGIMRSLIEYSFKFGLGLWTIRLNNQIGLVMLGTSMFVIPAAEIGNYRQALIIAMLLWQIPGILGPVIFSRGVNTEDQEASSRQAALLARMAMLAGLPFAVVLFVVAPYMMPLVYGADFAESGTIVRIFLPGILAFFFGRVFDADLSARGRPLLVVAVMGPVAVLNLVLMWVLIPLYGARGAATSSSICFGVGAFAQGVVFARVSGMRVRDVFMPRVSDFKMVADRLLRLAERSLGRARRGGESKGEESEVREVSDGPGSESA